MTSDESVVLRLALAGKTHSQIAQQIALPIDQVKRLVVRALLGSVPTAAELLAARERPRAAVRDGLRRRFGYE